MIAGNIDYIWGYSHAALFENCEIRTLGSSAGSISDGYILQARIEDPEDKGFVFFTCELTQGPGPKNNEPLEQSIYLARSGGGAGCYDNICFIILEWVN